MVTRLIRLYMRDNSPVYNYTVLFLNKDKSAIRDQQISKSNPAFLSFFPRVYPKYIYSIPTTSQRAHVAHQESYKPCHSVNPGKSNPPSANQKLDKKESKIVCGNIYSPIFAPRYEKR